MTQNNECLPEGICPSCFEGQLQDSRCDHVTELPNGRTVVVRDLPCGVCDHCDAQFFSPESTSKIEAEVIEALGTLAPDDVVRLVEMTGLSEAELCEKLGLGPKTIYRWRRGAQRPSKSLSVLLAVVACHPRLLGWIDSAGWKAALLGSGTENQRLPWISVAEGHHRRPMTPRVDRRNRGRTRPSAILETSATRTTLDRGTVTEQRDEITAFFALSGSHG